MFKNKILYIFIFSLLGIYSYKYFIFNNYIFQEIIIENRKRSDMRNKK